MKDNHTIEIDGKQFDLIYNVSAMKLLGEISGKTNIAEWFAEVTGQNADIVELASRTSQTICIMANAAISKHNFEVEMGLKNEEKKSKIPDGFFDEIIELSNVNKYVMALMKTINSNINFNIPKQLQSAVDEDYLEIEAEKKRE